MYDLHSSSSSLPCLANLFCQFACFSAGACKSLVYIFIGPLIASFNRLVRKLCAGVWSIEVNSIEVLKVSLVDERFGLSGRSTGARKTGRFKAERIFQLCPFSKTDTQLHRLNRVFGAPDSRLRHFTKAHEPDLVQILSTFVSFNQPFTNTTFRHKSQQPAEWPPQQ